jgi:hypothetical protein
MEVEFGVRLGVLKFSKIVCDLHSICFFIFEHLFFYYFYEM